MGISSGLFFELVDNLKRDEILAFGSTYFFMKIKEIYLKSLDPIIFP